MTDPLAALEKLSDLDYIREEQKVRKDLTLLFDTLTLGGKNVARFVDQTLLAKACAALPEFVAVARTCKEIANHGCGCGRTEDDISYWCEDLHPDDKERWCWSCLARPAVAALEARLAELGVGDE